MDHQSVFDWIVAAGGVAFGWMLKVIWEAIRDVKTEVRQLEHQVHQDFVRRDDFKTAVSEIKTDMREGFKDVKDMMGLISKKLDDKEDRA